MKLVVSFNDVKREFGSPFALCASTRDLDSLRQALEDEIRRRERDGISYGWFSIYPRLTIAPNTEPKKWEEP